MGWEDKQWHEFRHGKESAFWMLLVQRRLKKGRTFRKRVRFRSAIHRPAAFSHLPALSLRLRRVGSRNLHRGENGRRKGTFPLSSKAHGLAPRGFRGAHMAALMTLCGWTMITTLKPSTQSGIIRETSQGQEPSRSYVEMKRYYYFFALLLIALPINTALNIKSGKPLSAVSPGIDAYCVAQVGRNHSLGRVTTHHDLPLRWAGTFLNFSQKSIGILVLQRKVGSRIGMNEKVRLRFMERKASINSQCWAGID